MVAQPPAVVIVARHGMRLDAADQSWHLSTPTPYDPPLTYGGWNQCRALGVRIASLLHAREQVMSSIPAEGSDHGIYGTSMPYGRKRRRHKVVIHTSPFLRCLQTSVAISAGMAQFEEPRDRRPSTPRSLASMHSASPRLRAKDAGLSPVLAPIAEPRHHFARDIARRTLGEPMRHRKAKIRVDAFLGEWLNPSYFDQITPPPPSPMMVAGAKAELMQSENVDIFTPTLSHKSSGGSLWSAGRASGASRESPLDDWSHVTEALNSRPQIRRERSNSASSIGSNDSTGGHSSTSGRKSPFRLGGFLQPLTSTIPKPEFAVYRPPTPSYAISNSDYIPRGYITHARNATVNVDYQWDSSRAPLDWGSGGEYGEEWSSMHRRFRRGFNNLMEWYSQHNADARSEDALGLDQADHHHEEEDDHEELVVILVTHGAGSNALIGALTNQPVLLDVGMASLTMAVRKDDAPPLISPRPSNPASPLHEGTPRNSPDPAAMDGYHRRSSMDIGLSAIYDMKLVASMEHLRPGADPTRIPAPSNPATLKTGQEALTKYKQFGATAHAEAGAGIESNWDLGEPHVRLNSRSTAIGSIRRPHSSTTVPTRQTIGRNSLPLPDDEPFIPPVFTTGLWTPPSARGTPTMSDQKAADERNGHFPKMEEPISKEDSDQNILLNFATPSTTSRPPSAKAKHEDTTNELRRPKHQDSGIGDSEFVGNPPSISEQLPHALSRGLSQKGLWGNRPSGAQVTRRFENSKRRWTMTQGSD